MFLFVVNWADDENTHVNIHWPLNWLIIWYQGHSPRAFAEGISPAVLGSYMAISNQPLWCYSESPCIKTSLATDVSSMRLFFPLSVKGNPKITLYCPVAVNCDQESRVTWGVYVQPDLTRSQYTRAPTNKNNSTFWPGRSVSAKVLFGTFLLLHILLVNAPRLILSMIYECKYAKQIPNKTTGT